MSCEQYRISDVEEMLEGGSFRPSQDLQARVQVKLSKSAPAFPIPWLTWRGSLIALLAALVLTGGVIALSAREQAVSIVDGIEAVYEAELVHPVNETRQVGEASLSVDWVYADWNQILVSYTAEGRVQENAGLRAEIVSARLADGTILEGGTKTGYSLSGVSSNVAAFNMPDRLRNLSSINLQFVLKALTEQTQTPMRTNDTTAGQNQEAPVGSSVQLDPLTIVKTDLGSTSFDLAIPVTPGRVIEVGQTIEAEGYEVTLEQVLLAPSMTTARLCFEVPDPVHFRQWVSSVTLTAGSKGYSGGGDGYQAGEAYSCQRVEIQESVPLDRDRYVFRVDELIGFEFGAGEMVTTDMLPEDEWRVRGPWVFSLRDKP